MKQHLLTTVTMAGLCLGAVGTAQAGGHGDEVKIGIILGFTGPIESLAPDMANGAEFALNEVAQSGAFLGGAKLSSVRGDSTCVDNAAASAAAERLITADGVSGIMGADCSGVTGAVLANVALPQGMVMISPAATSPALSVVDDNGLFFRTAPSDARQGQVMAESLIEKGVMSVAVTYVNSDYGKGLVDSFVAAYEGLGGSVTISASHENDKGDYSADVAALSAAGGDRLVVAGYIDQGGSGIVRAALDTGAFDTFHFPDGMVGSNLEVNFGPEIEGSTGQAPGTDSEGAASFALTVGDAFDPVAPYAGESYDAMALILLAMQAAGSKAPADYKTKIMDVANAPGMKVFPGELDKALSALAAGEDIDYVGATDVELVGPGEASGRYREFEIQGGKMITLGYR